jgi:hypothetical protein
VRRVWPRALAATLAGLAVVAALAESPLLQPLIGPPGAPPWPWHVVGLPHQNKPLTRFQMVDLEGRRVLRVESESGYGNLVHPLQAGRAGQLGSHLVWQWRVDDLIEQADLRTKAGDDTALKVCVFFDLSISRVPFVERQLLRLARSASQEPLPASTVCYVWDSRLPVGTMLHNAYTHRVRYVVLQSGAAHLHEWMSERRDVAADFVALFGDESRELPPIMGVAIGADADNTRSHSLAHVAALVLEP